jgi:hypothetical protein
MPDDDETPEWQKRVFAEVACTACGGDLAKVATCQACGGSGLVPVPGVRAAVARIHDNIEHAAHQAQADPEVPCPCQACTAKRGSYSPGGEA